MDAALWILMAMTAGWALWRTALRMRRGGGCCGEHEQRVKPVRVASRRKARFPWEVELEIGGMICANCARRVENALNGMDGTLASVRVDTRRAVVRFRNPPDEAKVRQRVNEAGYVVTAWTWKTRP